MPKVRIIKDRVPFILVRKVNEFIKDKKVIDISYAVEPCGYHYTRKCCILYEEK